MRVGVWMLWAAAAALGLGALPAAAQMTTIDPNSAIDSDLQTPPPIENPSVPADQGTYRDAPPVDATPPVAAAQSAPAPAPAVDTRTQATNTFQHDDVVAAAEGVFGKGASGLAGILEDILKDQGQPNAYIAGSEGSGAVGVGLRYGKGEMFHKVEGERTVYWTGPSIGFDLGGDANKVFVLVYNLYDSQDLYKRFPQGEGHVYFVGGFSASYLRRGDVVLIPVRLGVGWRLGVNAGYMKFSEKRRIVPF
ncbi:DUF1134 domain-containing protein [Sphingomonas sp. JC676]|uniref:DUF1134 domain-containing protein n=1 Tax=Sphingomonas sp. JC676 TaxID=2768065 RepID=UPI0016582DD0|nr:DUF1134 domain-containing protein [Sphingomonas sp. JC676]MBC9034292.1 DUF1134 domain-containing protein [Sphingomonas sp. JC676]